MPQAGLTGTSQLKETAQYVSLEDFLGNKKELEAALTSFCEPAENEYQTSASTEEVAEHLGMSWNAIVSHAAQTSFTDERQLKLVEFVRALQRRPALAREGQTCQVHEMTVWEDLPTFGWKLRDAWNFDASQESDTERQEQWINVNAFTAALLGSTYAPIGDRLGLAMLGLWTVREGLESSRGDGHASSTAVAAAASWFVFAGPTMHQLCEQQTSFDGKLGRPGNAYQEASWKGFSTERWQTWADQLDGLQVTDSTARQLVEQARDAIRETRQ